MPATKTKPTPANGSTQSATAKTEREARAVDHVSQALEAAQGHLALIGGHLGADARDLAQERGESITILRGHRSHVDGGTITKGDVGGRLDG